MFRNKEFRQAAVICLLTGAGMTAWGFSISREAGIPVFLSGVVFWTVFYLLTRARYRSIARICEQIDLVLHNTDHIYISEAREGELSILQSEIMKMTMRIREQNAALIREKEHLADSLADIAHQLRTPLTAMNLTLSLLEHDPEETERRELLRETEELLVRMDWLVTSLLKLSRLDAGIVVFHYTQTDAGGLVTCALRPFLISLELHNLTVYTDVPEGIVIYGDKDWLCEALRNILKNCMESAGDGGVIRIACTDNPLYTALTIRDSGTGFSQEDLHYVFDRFYRGKHSGESGYGIGLALCRTIILRHGGTVTAKNHREGGAVFTIRFPK